MRGVQAVVVVITISVAEGVPELFYALDLQTGAVKVWDANVRSADVRMQARLSGRRPFLRTDEFPDRGRRIRRGEIVAELVVGCGIQNVPDGLIHQRIGKVFTPKAKLESLLGVPHDYGYKGFYKSVVVDSRLLACTATDQKASMTWQRLVCQSGGATSGDQSLATTLRQTCDAVNALARPPEPLECCVQSKPEL
jgi:hypothetical protein